MRIRAFSSATLCLVLLLAAVAPAAAVRRPDVTDGKPDFDARLPVADEDAAAFTLRRPSTEQRADAEAWSASLPGGVLRWDGMSGAPKWIAAPPGAVLSPAFLGTPEQAARRFLRDHAGMFGLSPFEIDLLALSSVVPEMNGAAHVHFTQRVGAIGVHDTHVVVNLLPDRSVISAGATAYAGLAGVGPIRVVPVDAIHIASHDVYPQRVVTGRVRSASEDGERLTVLEEPGFGRAPQARLLIFPEREGARLAWEVRVAEPTLQTDYRILVDAEDGRVLFRRNMTLYATARFLDAGGPDPEGEELAPSAYGLATIPASTTQSPAGWITGAGTSLAGNNATGHARYFTTPVLAEPGAAYDYPYDTNAAQLVNAWWWTNDAHDRFRAAGFDEAAGNYQQDNFGLGGAGGDPVKVVAWTTGGRNNAFYTSSPDGGVSTLNFFWAGCVLCGEHDGYAENGGERATGFMRDVVVHEYGHGVSTRMVGGPAVDNCLYGLQSGGMGEGWSDLFAASFFDDPRIGWHFFEGPGQMRDPRHDLGYAQLCRVGDFGCEVHSDGQIWFAALWDLRQSMIALDPSGGLAAFHRIVVRGLANTVCFPDFLDARDGILSADTTLFASAHHKAIWNVFAKRGMGQGSTSTGENDSAPVSSTTVPGGFVCGAPSSPTSATASAAGSNSIDVSFSAPGAAAVEIWREDADNPLDTFVKIAGASAVSPYTDTTVQAGRNYRYQVVSLGDGGVYCRSAASAATTNTSTTGACNAWPVFDPNLTIADGASNCAVTLSWSAASAGCPTAPAPIVYSVYRASVPGFDPSEATLIGRTAATAFVDTPPGDGRARYYLVLAQHGTTADPSDHRARGSSQVQRWVPRIPTLGRVQVQSWDFETGAQGWTPNNTADPNGAWTVLAPIGTSYAGIPFAPAVAAGGSGQAWVTGDTGVVPTTITATDCDGANTLQSPAFDGTGGRTIVSFDYWARLTGNFRGGLQLTVNNGSTSATLQDIGFQTVQSFDTDSRYGWQRAEVDLAKFVTPTANMRVTFTAARAEPLSEFGIDNVRVEQATVCARSALRIASVAVQDGTPGWGNGNGLLEPGETARLIVNLRNDGNAIAATPDGRIVGVPSGALVHEGSDTFPSLSPAATGNSLGTGFTVSAPTVACGDTLNVLFEFNDANGTRSVDFWRPEFGSIATDVVFQDTFETNLGWTASGTTAGKGIWQRGDPVGTLDGANPANPENDSPNDAGSNCYVTENGPVGGNVNANDVDNQYSQLASPAFDLSPYKRARLKLDLWYYDNSSGSDFWQDYGESQVYIDDGIINAYFFFDQGGTSGGWQAKNFNLTPDVPMIPNARIFLFAIDRDATFYSGATDSIVEMAVDNVRVEGDRLTCAASGVVNPPSGIGNTLRVNKSATVGPLWTASPVDGLHDAAAYYRLHVAPLPAGGWPTSDTTTTLAATRPLSGPSEFYLVSAANAAGASADVPAP